MSTWAHTYRQGSRRQIEKNIANGGQHEHVLDGLRQALAEEKALKRPRRWLLTAIQAKLDVIVPRIETLARINAIRQLEYRAERGPFTPAHAVPHFEAADRFHRLMPKGHVPPAPQVTRAEAFRWLDELPEDVPLTLYSFGTDTLYFGFWEQNAGGARG